MGGYMSGSQFGVKAGLRVGIFLALTIGFPFIVYGLIVATGARGVGGASGALAVVAGVYLKPIFIVAFLISLLSPCWRRMRSLGLPGFVGLLAPFLFLMDWPYLLIVGTHWGVAFSLGIWKASAPLYAMIALAMLVAMVVASPSDDGSPGERFGLVGWICGILAILLVVVALLNWGSMVLMLASIWFRPPGGRPAPMALPALVIYWSVLIKPFVCVAFCAVMALMTFMSRKEGSGHSPGGSETGGGPAMQSSPAASPGSSRVAFGRR
jgi:hypothetical protein